MNRTDAPSRPRRTPLPECSACGDTIYRLDYLWDSSGARVCSVRCLKNIGGVAKWYGHLGLSRDHPSNPFPPPPLPSKRQILDARERVQDMVRTHDWTNGKYKPLHLFCPCCRQPKRVIAPRYAVNPLCLLCQRHYEAEVKANLLRLSPESRVKDAWAALAGAGRR